MQLAKYYQLHGDKIQCNLCAHQCLIDDGRTGICGARKRKKDQLFSLVYGYPAAINVDPVEKKPLFHFFPGTQTYSLGTLGCNFGCANCQNWSISQSDQIENKVKQLDYLSPEKVVENAISEDCPSISFTYNEPTIFTEYALDIMKLAHSDSIKNIWVSNGYMSEQCLNDILPHLDAINIDLKSFDDSFYKENCLARLKPVMENLIRIKQAEVHLEITTLIIPSLSSDTDMLSELADFIANELGTDTPWHITRFSPEISWKLDDLSTTGDDSICEAHRIGKEAGLKYVYVGNVPGDQKENTYCPACKELAIMRLGYHLERHDSHGRCAYCDKSLDIIE